MIIISHRGLLDGPNYQLENKPEQIEKCISLGYDVEIDLRCENDKLYLGHDKPQYEISFEWLCHNRTSLWIHCKNPQSLFYMMDKNKDFDGFNFFYHNNDDYTLTSKGIIWSYPNKPYNKNCVVVLPEWNTSIHDLSQLLNSDCYGICTDFVNYLK